MSQSSFLKNLNETLNQPGVVAGCASVGFHVLIYAALPGLPIAYQQVSSGNYDSPEGNSNPDVGLIELNTAEISRIPDLSAPIAPAPPLLADTPPLPNIDQLLPQRPLTRNIPNVPPPSALPSIPPNPIALAPRLGTRPRRNNTRTFSPGLPPPPAISLAPPRRRSVTINPNNNRAVGLPQPPSADETEQRQQLPFGNPNPSSIGRVVPNLTIPGGLPGQTPPTPQGEPNLPAQPPANNNNNSTPPQTNPPGQSAPPNRSEGLELALQRIAQQREEFKQKEENTSEKDYRDNTLEWESEVAQNTNRQEVKRQDISIRGNYPNAACRLRNQDAVTVKIGFVVSPQGRASNPTILQRSGRPIFDQQALSQVSSGSYSNSTGQPVPYHASVNFTPPENCGGFVNEPASESEGQTVPQAQTPTPPPEKAPVQVAPTPESPALEPVQAAPEPEPPAPEPVQAAPEPEPPAPEPVQAAPEPEPPAPEPVQAAPEPEPPAPEPVQAEPEPEPPAPEPVQAEPEPAPPAPEPVQAEPEPAPPAPEPALVESEGEVE